MTKNHQPNILILGAGEIGSALGNIIRNAGYPVAFWDSEPKRVPQQQKLSEVTPDSDFVFICVPSWAVRKAVTACAKYLSPDTTVVVLAKGLEKPTDKLMNEVLLDVLPKNQPCALLAGPMLAEELVSGLIGTAVIATNKQGVCAKISALFHESSVVCEWTKDVQSTAILAVLKNIYALGLGVADGLGWGLNAKGWLIAAAAREMEIITPLLGGKRGIALQTAGLGDFVATALSPYSKNRDYGNQLVKTGACDLKSEGCSSLPLLRRRLGGKFATLPVLNSIYNVFYKKADPAKVFAQLITRDR